MSNPIAKAERSRAKDARQSPAPDTVPRMNRKKKKKPIVVEYKWREPLWPSWGIWKNWGRYRDVETAQTVIDNEKRKSADRYDMRIKDDGMQTVQQADLPD